tara:strand:- start:4085 stop:6265 length:2181 start_codon:yes stop_codon:yes gene_type:complete
MAKVVNTAVLEFSVKGDEIHVRALKKSGDAAKNYGKTLKGTNKESALAVRNFRNLHDANKKLIPTFSVLRSKVLLVAFGMGVLAKTVGKYINVAASAEEITNKFNVVFGEAAESASEFADTLGEATGRSSTKLREMLSALQDTFVPLGFARDESAKLSKALSRLSLDVASFNNRADDEVMKAFQSAIVGNHEAVRSFGIVLTEASIKEEALRSGIIKGNRELTAQEKVLARVSLIYKSTGDAQGDLIKTQDSYTNQLKAFNDQLFELQRQVGEALMPLAADMLELMAQFADVEHLQAFAVVLGTVGLALGAVRLKALGATAAVKGFNVVVKGSLIYLTVLAVDEIARLIKHFKNKGDTIKKTKVELDDYSKSFQNLNNILAQKNIEISTKAYKEALETYRSHSQAVHDSEQKILEEKQAIKELNKNNKIRGSFLAFLVGEINKKIAAEENNIFKSKLAMKAAEEEADAIYELIKPTKEHAKWLEENSKAYEAGASAQHYWQEQFDTRLDFNEKLKTLQTSAFDLQVNFLNAEIEEFKAAGIKEEELEIYKQERLKQIREESASHSINLADAMGDALSTAFDTDAGAGEAFKGFIIQVLQMIQQTILASKALNEALTFTWVPGLGAGVAMAAFIALEAAKASVRSIKFAATGMNEIVNEPTMIIAGEAGAERVNITPLSGGSSGGQSSGGGGVTVNISGGIVQDDYVRNELIPALNKATGTGTKINA